MTGVASLPHNPVSASRLSGRTALESPTLLTPHEIHVNQRRFHTQNKEKSKAFQAVQY